MLYINGLMSKMSYYKFSTYFHNKPQGLGDYPSYFFMVVCVGSIGARVNIGLNQLIFPSIQSIHKKMGQTSEKNAHIVLIFRWEYNKPNVISYGKLLRGL